jgi:hypothetical protein
MKKLAALAGVALVAFAPAAAEAHSKTKIYRGSFQLVGADGSYTNDSFGKAQLNDGKKNDQLSVHVRKLGSKQKYVFRLQSAATACEEGAAGGTDVPGWTYRRGGLLVTNRKGVANSWARSRSFTVDRSVEYFVGVYTRDASGDPDQLVACAQLTKKHKSKKGHGKPGADKPKGNDKPKGDDKSKGNANGQGKDKTQGGDNGQGKDKGRGNDDKPRSTDKPHGNGHGNDKGDD